MNQRKSTLVVVVSVLLVGLLVSGCGGGGSKSRPTAGITGQVTDAAGLPIAGATARAGGQVTTTDSTGGFNLTGVTTGRTRIWITADEHEPYYKTLDLAAGALALGQVKLTATSGTSFYSVQVDRGSGSITLPGLSPSDSVAVVVSSRNTASGSPNTTSASSRDMIAASALPGYRVKGIGRQVLGLPAVGRSLHSFLRESEREMLRAGYGTRWRRSQFLFGGPQYKAVGDTESFWVLNKDVDLPTATDWSYKPATLKYATGSVYIYVDDEDLSTVTQTVIDGLGESFSNPGGIYDTTRGYFGNEPSPGVDNETPVYVLLSSELPPNYAGYFWGVNELTDAEAMQYAQAWGYVLRSNQKEIVLLRPRPEVGLMQGTLAHEFEHMIFFNERGDFAEPEPTTWLNEGFATMSEELNGFGIEAGNTDLLAQINYYTINTASQSLTEWGEGNGLDDYGAVYLFMRYIVDRFGGASPGILWTIMRTNASARQAVGSAVGMDFDDLFTDWTLALFLDNSGWVSGSRFNYGTDSLFHKTYGSITLDGVATYPGLPSSFSSRQYGVDYAGLSGLTGPVTLSFSASGAPLTDVMVITHK